MIIAPSVIVEASSVEALLSAASFALGPESMSGWLGGPMRESLQGRAQERFAVEGTDDGPWAPLADATLSWRASYGFGPGPINRRTGELERFITGAPGSVTPHPGGATLSFPGSEPTGELGRKVRVAQGYEEANDIPARHVVGLGLPDLEFALLSFGAWFGQSVMAGTP